MKKATLLLVFILTCNFALAQNYFMKFHGIVGETTDKNHQGWSDVLALNFELNADIGDQVGQSRRRGATSETISFVKKIDKSSPKIMEACAMGKIIPVALIEISNSGRVIYRYELKNVRITNYSVEGIKSDIPQDEYSLAYEERKVTYFVFDSSGKPKGKIETKWNLESFKID